MPIQDASTSGRNRARFTTYALALIIAFTAAVYLPRLGDAPIYLDPDEVDAGLTANSLADHGRDRFGQFLPLFLKKLDGSFWFPPILPYSIAIALKILPFSEATIRVPMVLMGILDVVLVFQIALILFDRTGLAMIAGILLAICPTHFVMSRLAMDPQASNPFVLAWLLSALLFFRRGEKRFLFTAGVMLGAGMFSYVGAMPKMPLYVLFTGALVFGRSKQLTRFASLGAGLLVPASLLLLWLWQNSSIVPRSMFLHYQDPNNPAAAEGSVLAMAMRYADLRQAASLYWNFWDPRFLFIDGAISKFATKQIGAFLLPVAGLLAIALWRIIRGQMKSPHLVLLLGGLLLAPLPASLVDVNAAAGGHAIWRGLEVVPFGVLLAIFGLDYLWISGSTRERPWLVVVACLTPVVLLAVYSDHLPRERGLLPLATVPLTATALGVLLTDVIWPRSDCPSLAQFVCIGLCVTLTSGFLYAFSDLHEVGRAAVILLAVVSAAALTDRFRTSALTLGASSIVATLLLISSQSVYLAFDRNANEPIAGIRSAAVLTGVVGMLPLARRFVTMSRNRRLAALAVFSLVVSQAAYICFQDYAGYEWVASSIVPGCVAGAGVAALAYAMSRRRSSSQFVMIAMLSISAVQCSYFYADYFKESGSFVLPSVHNERRGFEKLIDVADRSSSMLYLGMRYDYAMHYWRFYLLKHRREDLIARSMLFDADAIETSALAPGSVVLTPVGWGSVDRAIEGMVRRDALRIVEVVREEGAPIYWILEKT